MIAEEVKTVKKKISLVKEKSVKLKELDMFLLDNSIRESTVGQLRGHTVENKFKIFDEVVKCNIKHIVVAAFSHSPRVDDTFVEELQTKRDLTDLNLYAFTEITDAVSNGRLDDTVTCSLKKMKELKLCNPIIEIDLNDSRVDWGNKFTVKDMCNLLESRIKWAKSNLCNETKVIINLRDFPFAMERCLDSVLTVVGFLSSLPSQLKPFGLAFEEPTGRYSVGEMSTWTESIRNVMTTNGWGSGHLLAHIHQKWGMAETVQLECLGSGADGVWASLCEEGAASGHACSTVTLMNLVRMGNKKVLEKYKCMYLREAAKNITNYTTGYDPHPKQIVYGDRAMDLVFDLEGIAGGKDDFDLGKFFNVSRPIRISTLSTPDMILAHLKTLFGDNPNFTLEIAKDMQDLIKRDLIDGRKEEYMSEVGIALLFDRSGGALTNDMKNIIEKVLVTSEKAKRLIAEVRNIWDTWDLKESIDKQGDEALEFDSFYNGFMMPYFGCFRCDDTRKGLQAIDMDNDGNVDWNEFLVYLKWALNQYPDDIDDVNTLLSITFRKGLIPAMQDEIISSQN